jgi:hypothetical protein
LTPYVGNSRHVNYFRQIAADHEPTAAMLRAA